MRLGTNIILGLIFSHVLCAQQLPYTLNEPSNSLKLSSELDEISGLSYCPTTASLVAVQDEDGIVFALNPNTGEIIGQQDFWKEGDYEGVEQCGTDTYVVKSTGTLYTVKNLGKEEQSTQKYNGFLDADYDVEGLGYWPARQQLLIGCKASPGEGFDDDEVRAIYAYDLQTKQLQTTPLILLRRDAVEEYLHACNKGPHHQKICSIFSREKEDFDLKIAALAVHPISQNIYLTSAKGNLLIVVDGQGNILHISKLPKDLHRQPEGLCFDPQGNLYIANEAKKDEPPVIHRYNIDPNAGLSGY